MTKDLDMPANTLKYNTAVTIFFVPYTLLEVPSNIILKKMRPSYWMAILMFAWGTVMTLMGVVTSYGGLLAARFFLGVTEVCVLRSILQCQAHFLGWFLPRCNFSSDDLVPTFRAPAPHGRLLHFRITRRCVFRPACIRHPAARWPLWIRRVSTL
jgi:hypothetical protein